MANQSFVRLVNERRVLTLLRLDGPTTRAAISRKLALTRSSISNVIDSLLSRELVREDATPENTTGTTHSGRPGVNVSLNPHGAYLLGVEIDLNILRLAVMDLAGNIVVKRTVTVSTDRSEDFVSEITAFVDHLRTSRTPVNAIGVTVPGLVQLDGFVVHLPVLGWKNVNLGSEIEQRTQLPVLVENNTNAAAFGEVYGFSGEKRGFILYLKLGVGCGGAAVMNGRLIRGATGTATEFGHMRISASGPITCSCGRSGCLETYVNLDALARAWAPDATMTLTEKIALPARIYAEAERKNKAARSAIDVLRQPLLTGLISLTNLFNPNEIVLGGIMRPLLSLIVGDLQQGLRAGVIPGMSVPRLTLSTSKEYECAVGAAAIGHHQSFDVSNIEVEAD
jgi:N-acetylglucosamine repressor